MAHIGELQRTHSGQLHSSATLLQVWRPPAECRQMQRPKPLVRQGGPLEQQAGLEGPGDTSGRCQDKLVARQLLVDLALARHRC